MHIWALARIEQALFLIRTGLAFSKWIWVARRVFKSSKSVDGFVWTLTFRWHHRNKSREAKSVLWGHSTSWSILQLFFIKMLPENIYIFKYVHSFCGTPCLEITIYCNSMEMLIINVLLFIYVYSELIFMMEFIYTFFSPDIKLKN